MRFSPLGPSKAVYLGLAAVALLAAGPAQWLAERGRRAALGEPRANIQMVELWPVLMGGFRGPLIAGLAYYATEAETEADIYSTRSTIRWLIELQPEFDNLWIYYSWVVAYNLGAVVSPPEEKYTFIVDGVKFLDEGVKRIASLYERNLPYANTRCPITGRPIDWNNVPADQTRSYQGRTVVFYDISGPMQWDRLTDDKKAVKLEAVRAGNLEYKRRRATLLYMRGWTYDHTLAQSKEAKQFYRAWYKRDYGKDQDPYEIA